MNDPLFDHVYLEKNAMADKLIRFGSLMNGGDIKIFQHLPLFVMDLLEVDQGGA